ncbi:glycyl-tRNA synthetase beta chain [Acidiphilium rubrum]|uniref:Glycine--tRNA ligase beta subunit n=2 Tax=Acidocellaceae TaxID=3385905 RepID=A0A8G2CMJ1_ACIRU|nr:glycyl-tRNA synthetase beta chain [Acidiphilium rubrum]
MRSANDFIVKELSDVLLKFPWPKSMRWGQSGTLLWVRPLRRIVCLLDHRVVPLVVGPITASNLSEGHRFLAPGTFKVVNAAQWQAELLRRRVIADAPARRAMIADGLQREAQALGLSIVKDDGLLDEVTGLVEYPVPLIGRIEQRFMALPPEVRELSMKVNQRYFSTRDAVGEPAPYFAFVANIEASDGGAAIIAGNERVLRARLADAEHFWAQDRQHPLEDYLPKLKSVVFHAKLGTQFERAERIAKLAREIAEKLGADSQEIDAAERAGRLCKADLVTGMVGEFPELQGIMGGYYAGEAVGAAIRRHYQPKGPSDEVPQGIVPCAVALADKLDTLREFFRIGETPTGSGDPYALRRAALGVVRIILENDLQLHLRSLLDDAVFDFLIERFRVKLRGEGKRFDVVNAILANMADDDLLRIQQRGDALESFTKTDDGANLLVAYRRGVNILRIENEKDGPHVGEVDESALVEDAEIKLSIAIHTLETRLSHAPHLNGPGVLDQRNFDTALQGLASLRSPVDAFFKDVTVNAEDPALRRNRLRLLAKLRDVMHRVADFSKLEG